MFGASSSAARIDYPDELGQLAQQLPPNIRLGTSSWNFPGWKGVVYSPGATQRAIAQDGLEAYAHHPLFRTVCVDSGFHSLIPVERYQKYQRSVGSGFRFVVKAHHDACFVNFPDQPQFGPKAGKKNPFFLDAEYAAEHIVEPFRSGLIGDDHILLFQIPPQGLAGGAKAFATRIGDFLAKLPTGLRYAVELRNKDYFTPRYLAAVQDNGAEHCIGAHPSMPSIEKQFRVTQSPRTNGDGRKFVLVRWMLHDGLTYEQAKTRFAPFDTFSQPDPATRECLTRQLTTTVDPCVDCMVILNNHAEGSSPHSVEHLARAIATRTSTNEATKPDVHENTETAQRSEDC